MKKPNLNETKKKQIVQFHILLALGLFVTACAFHIAFMFREGLLFNLFQLMHIIFIIKNGQEYFEN